MKSADWKTVLAARKGNPEAWDKLYTSNQPRVFKVIRKIVKDFELTEDLTQDTFLNAHEHLKGFKGKSTFSTWIYTIAKNNARMYVRKKRIRSAKSVDDIDLPMPGIFIDSKTMHKTALTTAMNTLTTKRRLAIIWKAIDGLTNEEIGIRLGITTSGSKSLVFQGYIQMRKHLIMQGYRDKNAQTDSKKELHTLRTAL